MAGEGITPVGARAVSWREEVAATFKLTIPIAAALLAEMGMVVIDHMMAGRLGNSAMAAVGLGGQLIFIPILWAMGALAAVGAVAAQAHGAGNRSLIQESIRQGFRLATLMSLPCLAFYLIAWPLLPVVEDDQIVVDQVRSMIPWALPMVPLTLWFTVLRNFVTVMNRPAIVTISAIAGLAVTAISNYLFMYGKFGFPKMGVAATGLTASIATAVQLVVIVIYVLRDADLRGYDVFSALRRANRTVFNDLLKIGLPIAMGYVFESGLFFTATFLMALFTVTDLAAHNPVMNISSITFMIPYALSQAATVRVGYRTGEGWPNAARLAGNIAIIMGLGWMSLAAALMWFAPNLLVGLYLDLDDPQNAETIVTAAGFMTIAAIFQLADGLQVTALGALRGLKDTRVPMLLCGLGYWAFGLLSAVVLAFALDVGAIGLWLGIAIGLCVSSTLLLSRWLMLSRRLASGMVL